MLSLSLAAAAAQAPIYWQDLGLKPYLFQIGGFELRWYSLAYLAGIVLGYWHLTRMMKAPGSPLAQRCSRGRHWAPRCRRGFTHCPVSSVPAWYSRA